MTWGRRHRASPLSPISSPSALHHASMAGARLKNAPSAIRNTALLSGRRPVAKGSFGRQWTSSCLQTERSRLKSRPTLPSRSEARTVVCRVGCMGCDLERAGAYARLPPCNRRRLPGASVMYTMGWATSNSHVWSKEEADAGGALSASWSGEAPGATTSGLGLLR